MVKIMNDPKYIRIFSDIHLDFDIPSNHKNFNPDTDIWTPPPFSTDKKTILILAGDIWHAKKPFSFMNFSWFKKISSHFHSIIVILGNHDFWGGNLETEYSNYLKNIKEQGLTNIHLLQDNTLIIGKNKFIGGTLWTDYDNANPHIMRAAESLMNDFKYIRNGKTFTKLRATHLLGAHAKTARYIKENSHKDYPEQILWVITHHLPSYQSIPPQFQYDGHEAENAMYASNLEHLMNKDISAWIHGHSHLHAYYKINDTQIIANPRGYRGEETNYDPYLLFDLEGNKIENHAAFND
jgi:predicted phosphodiesterase